jgi:hypothetical protein
MDPIRLFDKLRRMWGGGHKRENWAINLVCVYCSGGGVTALIGTPELDKGELLEACAIISYSAMCSTNSSLTGDWLT